MYQNLEYLLTKLVVEVSPTFGPSIALLNYEHFDYIDDVLTELFDIDYSFRVVADDGVSTTMYFEDKADFQSVSGAVETINRYHSEKQCLYALPSDT